MRTTGTLVRQVIEVDSSFTDDNLIPFITLANELVTEKCLPEGYSDNRLQLIETWLAAHFYGIRDKQIASEGVKGITAAYQSSIGKFLMGTMQGQQALALDTNGALARMNQAMVTGASQTVGVLSLGRNDCERDGQ